MPARRRGFSLVELLGVLAIMAVLAAVAYPAYRGAMQKTRRADALATLLNLQAAQERHRANHVAYASLAQLGLAATTPQGHYEIAVTAPGATGYQAVASALGTQADDTHCRHFRLTVAGGNVIQSSGPDPATGNADAENRRCWGS